MDTSYSRRKFLWTGSIAAAMGVAIQGAPLQGFAADSLAARQPGEASDPPFLFLPSGELEDLSRSLSPGASKQIVDTGWKLPFTITMSSEQNSHAKEFEFHEHRDHVFRILDGSTQYEVGGKPQNAHLIRPGEWLAPESEGASKMMLHAGDMLVVPRGTPHRRTTTEHVVLLLISTDTP